MTVNVDTVRMRSFWPLVTVNVELVKMQSFWPLAMVNVDTVHVGEAVPLATGDGKRGHGADANLLAPGAGDVETPSRPFTCASWWLNRSRSLDFTRFDEHTSHALSVLAFQTTSPVPWNRACPPR